MIKTRISVDFASPNRNVQVEAMQADGATRTVDITLLANGFRWEPPAGVDAAMAYRQPDGHKGVYDKLADGSPAITVSGNVASVVLIPQMLAVAGNVQCQLVFNDSKLDRLTSFPFVLQVAKNQIAGAQPVQDYVRLQWMEDKLDELLRKAADSGAFRGEQGEPGQQGPQGEPGVSPTINGKSADETGNVTLTAADVGALPSSGGDMTGSINMNGQPISGLNPPTEDTQAANKEYVDTAKSEAISHANAAVRKAARRDLVDNGYFRNPVNQRGETIYTAVTGGAYTIDRWVAFGVPSTVEITSDGVLLTGVDTVLFFSQFLEEKSIPKGKAITFAFEDSNGNVYCGTGTIPTSLPSSQTDYVSVSGLPDAIASAKLRWRSDGKYQLFIAVNSGRTITIKWAALYEGEYTAETLPEYQPKGYAAELLECQRYYVKMTIYGRNPMIFSSSTSNTYYLSRQISLSIKMRITPTITDITTMRAYIYGVGWRDFDSFPLTLTVRPGNQITFTGNVAENTENVLDVYFVFALNADL